MCFSLATSEIQGSQLLHWFLVQLGAYTGLWAPILLVLAGYLPRLDLQGPRGHWTLEGPYFHATTGSKENRGECCENRLRFCLSNTPNERLTTLGAATLHRGRFSSDFTSDDG